MLNIYHICIYCYTYKIQYYRWDVSKDDTPRTSQSMQRCLVKHSMGVVNPPLVEFEIEDIIVDELHLMLRISDILIRNIIFAMIYCDIKTRSKTNTTYRQITECNQIMWNYISGRCIYVP